MKHFWNALVRNQKALLKILFLYGATVTAICLSGLIVSYGNNSNHIIIQNLLYGFFTFLAVLSIIEMVTKDKVYFYSSHLSEITATALAALWTRALITRKYTFQSKSGTTFDLTLSKRGRFKLTTQDLHFSVKGLNFSLAIGSNIRSQITSSELSKDELLLIKKILIEAVEALSFHESLKEELSQKEYQSKNHDYQKALAEKLGKALVFQEEISSSSLNFKKVLKLNSDKESYL